MSQPIDLATVLARGGPMDPARAVEVVRQIAAAVEHSHAQGPVHRDVSTATILISNDGTARLAEPRAPMLDRPPELLRNTEASYRADIHALAGVLYECLAGEAAPNPLTPGASARRPGIPPGFDEVIARGGATHPAESYRSITELAEAAQQALARGRREVPSSRPTTPGPLPPPPVPRTRGQQPGWDPYYGRGPTVTFPASGPSPLPPGRPTRRRRAAIVGLVVIVAAVAGLAGLLIPRLTRAASNAPVSHTYTSAPTTLPFPRLDLAKRAAVDANGGLYVLSSLEPGPTGGNDRVLLLLAKGAPNSTTKDVPGVDLRLATDVTVDQHGNLYVCDGKSVWELAAGAADPIRLPFRGFNTIDAVAVDAAGNTYAAGSVPDVGTNIKYAVRKLATDANRPTDLPFTDLYQPRAMALDRTGTLYVGDGVRANGKGRVQKLAAGSANPIQLSFPGLLETSQMAVDRNGNLFVADAWQTKAGVFQLPTGTTTATRLPVSLRASAVAVDEEDNLYIAASAAKDNTGNIVKPGQVSKLVPDK